MTAARNAAAYWFAQMSDLVLRMVVMLVVARVLGPDLRGVLVSALLVNTMLVNLANPGLQSAAMYFTGRRGGAGLVLRPLHRRMIGIVVCTAIADWLLAAAAFALPRGTSASDSVPLPLVTLVLAAVPFSLYSMVAQGALAGLGRVDRLARVMFRYSVGIHLVNVAALVPFLRRPELLPGILVCVWSAGEVVRALLLGRELVGAAGGLRDAGRTEAAAAPEVDPASAPVRASELLSYGLRAQMGNAASVLVSRADHLFILAAGGPVGIGLYSLSARMAEPVFLLSAGVEAAGYSRVVTAADSRTAMRATASLLRAMVLVSLVSLPALALVGDPLFRRALPGFADARVPFLVLLPGAGFLACSRMLSLYFSAHLGRPQIPSLIAWLAAAANLAGLSAVVIYGGRGLTGAAGVTTASYGLMFFSHLILFIRTPGAPGLRECLVPRREDLARVRSLLPGGRGAAE